jgi:hypothetical protein
MLPASLRNAPERFAVRRLSWKPWAQPRDQVEDFGLAGGGLDKGGGDLLRDLVDGDDLHSISWVVG